MMIKCSMTPKEQSNNYNNYQDGLCEKGKSIQYPHSPTFFTSLNQKITISYPIYIQDVFKYSNAITDKDADALIKQSAITWFDGQRKKNIQLEEDWEDFDNIRLLAIHDISHAPQSVPTIHTIAIQIACIIEIAIQNVIKHKYLLSQDDDQPNTTSNTT